MILTHEGLRRNARCRAEPVSDRRGSPHHLLYRGRRRQGARPELQIHGGRSKARPSPPASAPTASPSALRTVRAKVRTRCSSGFTRSRFELLSAAISHYQELTLLRPRHGLRRGRGAVVRQERQVGEGEADEVGLLKKQRAAKSPSPPVCFSDSNYAPASIVESAEERVCSHSWKATTSFSRASRKSWES